MGVKSYISRISYSITRGGWTKKRPLYEKARAHLVFAKSLTKVLTLFLQMRL